MPQGNKTHDEPLAEAKFQNLCSHYKDSYDIHLSSRKEREIIFYALLFVISFFSLQITSADFANIAFSEFAKQQSGISIDKNSDFLSSLSWLLLFGLSAKYYQIHTRIEREYKYLHSIEEIINAYYPKSMAFTREGKSYLSNYPAFSDWMDFVYKTIFPLSIVISSTTKIYRECFTANVMHLILYVSIIISTTLYFLYANSYAIKKTKAKLASFFH